MFGTYKKMAVAILLLHYVYMVFATNMAQVPPYPCKPLQTLSLYYCDGKGSPG